MSKVTYDKKSNILSIKLKSGKSVDSEVNGNIVIDYDEKGKVVRVDVMNFTLEDFGISVGKIKELVQVS